VKIETKFGRLITFLFSNFGFSSFPTMPKYVDRRLSFEKIGTKVQNLVI